MTVIGEPLILGTPYQLIGSAEYTVSTTSTSAAAVGTIACTPSALTADGVIYVRVRDKAGPRSGYFFGCDTFFYNYAVANGSSSGTATQCLQAVIRYADNAFAQQLGTGGYGVYGYSISADGVVIRRRYNSTNSLTINGTYLCEVYLLRGPGGRKPYAK